MGAAAMSYQRPRAGIYATVNGAEYLCNDYPNDDRVMLIARERDNPDPELFARDEANQLWTAEVHVDQCERLADVTSRAQYLGHRCQVISIAPNGDVGLYFLDDDKSEARKDGFVQVDPGTWAKTVNVYDLHTYYEQHADLLYERWWRTHHPAST
jgi:hypothetical protein